MTFKNDEINRQKFTETEIVTLKNIAQNALKPQTIEEISEVEINKNIENLKEPTSIAKIDLKEKLNNIKNLFSNFEKVSIMKLKGLMKLFLISFLISQSRNAGNGLHR